VIDPPPLALTGDRLGGLNLLVIARLGREINPGMRRLQIGQHRSSSPGSVAFAATGKRANPTLSMLRG
jgi:hypothetical protein